MDRLQHIATGGTSNGRKIVTVVNSLSPTSMPLNEFVAWRARRLPNERHVVVSLAGTPSAGPGFESPDNVEILTCAGRRGLFIRQARKLLRDESASGERTIVHCHQPRSGALFQIASLGMRSRTPVLFTVHSMFSRYTQKTRAISAFNCLRADQVTIVSHAASDAFPDSVRRLRSDVFSVIPNGVDLERVDAIRASVDVEREERGSIGRRFELVNVAMFGGPDKGHDFLLDVVGRVPDVGLTLVGDGGIRPRIEERVRDEGLSDRVRFTGLLSREAVYAELLAADLFVSPSVREGLPIAVLEAMALDRPVLLSDIPPHREILSKGEVLPLMPFDRKAWVEAIAQIAGRSTESRRAEGDANRRIVERDFTLARMHDAYTETYEMMIERGSRSG